eukprot:scaffold178141_cov45-Prasinocladus_malaysianus.AAC.1
MTRSNLVVISITIDDCKAITLRGKKLVVKLYWTQHHYLIKINKTHITTTLLAHPVRKIWQPAESPSHANFQLPYDVVLLSAPKPISSTRRLSGEQ